MNSSKQQHHLQKNSPSTISAWLYLIIAILLIFLLSLRMGNHNLLTASLWAEDGRVFIEQSSKGWQSLWTPYAGYIHLYPRLVALIAHHAPLLNTPAIFNIGWLFAYISAAFALVNYIQRQTGSPLLSVLACVAFSCTPQTGETLFTLTNSQWYIGTALLLYMLHKDSTPLSLIGNFLLFIACLSGPFVLLGAPFSLYVAISSRGKAKSKASYLIIITGICIQAMTLIINGRPNMELPLDTSIAHWMQPIKAFFLFGADKQTAVLASVVFWIAGATAILHGWSSLESEKKRTLVIASLLAALCFLAGLSTAKHEPQVLNPLGAGARYFLIPYALSFFSIAICLPGRRILGWIVLFSIAVVSKMLFTSVDRGEFQWKAYARLAEQADNISIPLAPKLPSYPGWSAYPYRPLTGHQFITVPLQQLKLSGIERATDTTEELIPTAPDNQISFSIPQCTGGRYVGLLIDVDRPNAGDVQVYWGNNFAFSEQKSLRRFYPAGPVTAQLAFRKSRSDDTVRVDLSESLGSLRLSSIRAICLDLNSL